jgi:hypothetical protein
MCAAPRRSPRNIAGSAPRDELARVLASALLRGVARRVGRGLHRLLCDERPRGSAHASATDGGQEGGRCERRDDARRRGGLRARPCTLGHATFGGIASRIGRTRERRRAACRVDHEPVRRAVRSRHGCTVPRIAPGRLPGDRGTLRSADRSMAATWRRVVSGSRATAARRRLLPRRAWRRPTASS